MAVITIYKTDTYKEEYKKLFSGIYNDFRNSASTEYNFELQPLSYEKFTQSIEKGLLNCLILFEDGIPTGFLVYTTLISESLELNIIHCIGNENINEKRKLLLSEFIEINKPIMREKTVTYPMLGKQNSFAEEIKEFGFQTVNTAVTVFNLSDVKAINKLKMSEFPMLPKEYTVTNWKNHYFKDVADIICQSFSESSDRLFDNRFATVKGCRDITEKITKDIYGKFLPEITKVLLYKKRPVGICFVNLTNEKIANIPLVAVLKQHRNHRFGKIMLKSAVSDLIMTETVNGPSLQEINASCDADNMSATDMYDSTGFSVKYTYAQAYHPQIKD